MKRFIAVASLAVLAAPAFAADLPYEQTPVDRALPAVSEKAIAVKAPRAVGAPYEQTQLERILPDVAERAGEASVGATFESGVWAKDHNFIAPAQ